MMTETQKWDRQMYVRTEDHRRTVQLLNANHLGHKNLFNGDIK
jgi:hypothetical protein